MKQVDLGHYNTFQRSARDFCRYTIYLVRAPTLRRLGLSRVIPRRVSSNREWRDNVREPLDR